MKEIFYSIFYNLGDNVSSVHDGDTFTVWDGRRIRLWGIDAEEIGQPKGEESRQALIRELSKGELEIIEQSMDRGRTVAIVMQDRKKLFGLLGSERVNINKEMVRLGYAYVDERYAGDFFDAELKEAKSAKRGVHSYKGERPRNYRERMKLESRERVEYDSKDAVPKVKTSKAAKK